MTFMKLSTSFYLSGLLLFLTHSPLCAGPVDRILPSGCDKPSVGMLGPTLHLSTVLAVDNPLNGFEVHHAWESRLNAFHVASSGRSAVGFSNLRTVGFFRSDSTSRNNPVVSNLNGSIDGFTSTLRIILEDGWTVITKPFHLSRSETLWLGGFIGSCGLVYVCDPDIRRMIQCNRETPVFRNILDAGYFFEPVGLTRNNLPYFLSGFATGYIMRWEKLQEISIQLIESVVIEGNTRVGIFNLAGRARPSTGRGPRFWKWKDDRSFPSGHTANIFQLATILSHHIDRWWFSAASYAIASTVAMQRIDDDAHWPSDVLFGAVYGTLISRAVISLHEQRKLAVIPRLSIRQEILCLGFTWSF